MSRRWWLLLLAALLLASVVQFAPWPPSWADAVYLGATLPFWSALSAPLIDSLTGSLSALLLIALLVILCLALVAGGRARHATLRGLVVVVAVLALGFPFTFGLGYHTTPLEARLALVATAAATDAAPTYDRATDLATDSATMAAARERARQLVLELLREAQPPDTSSTPSDSSNLAATAATCLRAYLSTIFVRPAATIPTRIKAIPSGWLLRIGFAGVISPWLLEPHVDAALPPRNALAVALHELAHTAGFAREAEAEAVALLAGLACEDAHVRYAAALKAASSLAYELPAAEREAYLAGWPAKALADAAAAAAVAAEYRSAAAARLAEGVYDTYLSSQGGEGLDDYRRATDLLVLGLEGSSR